MNGGKRARACGSRRQGVKGLRVGLGWFRLRVVMEQLFVSLGKGLSMFYKALREEGLEEGFAEELTRTLLRELTELFKLATQREIERREG